MGYWRFKSYESDDGNQPWEWLSLQSDDVRHYIWGQLWAISNIEESPLEESGDYQGLSQLIIPFDEGTRQVALIGIWEPESQYFIVFHCTEVDQYSYGLALERALECKRNWEEQLGDIYDLFPDDGIN